VVISWCKAFSRKGELSVFNLIITIGAIKPPPIIIIES